jgi:hypothetical protein
MSQVPAHEGCRAFQSVLDDLGGIRVSNIESAPENQRIAQVRGDIHASQRDEPGARIGRFLAQDPGDLRTELLRNSFRST